MRLLPVFAFAGLLAPWVLRAQERKDALEPAFYKVEINIADPADASAKSVRHYTLITDSGGKATLRANSRIPYSIIVNSSPQFQYTEVSVNLDCRLRESGGKVILMLDAQLSNPLSPVTSEPTNPPGPTIVTASVSVSAILVPGKSAQIAAINDPASQRKLSLDAVVTKLN